ncbi:MAG: hypothetical protein AABY15_08680 [Nanoarchaeota archaeon]
MPELNTISQGDFVKLANIIFEKAKDSVQQLARTSGLFKVDPLPLNSGESREYTSIDLEEYAKRKPEGDQAKRAKVQQGYTRTLTLYRVAEDIGITYEMRTRNKYPDVIARLTNLASLGINRLDLDLSHRVGFGTAASYTDLDGVVVSITLGDGLSFFNTAHTLRGSSATYRNRLAGNPQLSRGALESIERQAIENTLNQFGEKVTVPYDILWTTDDPNTVNTAREYLQSTAEISAPNAGVINVYKGKYRHITLPRVATTATGAVDTAKRKYWGVASSMFSSAHLAVSEEPRLKTPPADGKSNEEFSTDDWNFGVRGGWGIAIVDGNWMQFSSGDGAA